MTGLLIVLLVVLAHGWALQQFAALLGPLGDAPQAVSQIKQPMLTRTIIMDAPATAIQPPQEPAAAAPRRSPSTTKPGPAVAASPAPESLVVAMMVSPPAPAPDVTAPAPQAVNQIAAAAMPLAPASRPAASSAPPPASVELAVAGHPQPVPLPAREPPAPVPVPTTVAAPPPSAAPVAPTSPAPASVALVAAALEESAQGAAFVATAPVAAPLRPLVVPASIGLAYQLEINSFPLPARAELRWRHDGAQYEASLSLLSLLSIVRTSKGAITPQGLEPLRYGEKITARSETAVHFQRDKGLVSFSNNKPSVALVAGMQDEVSAFFQLAAQLGGDPRRYTAGTEIPLQTVDSRALRSIVFVVGSAQTLELPGGRMQTLYLSHSEPPAFEGSRGSKGEVWAAPALDYLPVRIRITEPSGTTYDLRWSQTLAP